MKERPLDQRAVDELVAAVRAGKVPTGRASLAVAANAQRVDLKDPSWTQDRIVRRRLPVLDTVFDRFVPSLQLTLTKSLRFPVRAENNGVELMKFGDFRARLEGKPCLFEVMRLDPMRGSGVVVFDSTVLYALVDALMGGLGVGELPADREVSEIEASLLHRAHLDLLRDFENAWRPWFPLRVEHVRTERTMQIVSTISDEDVCHVATIAVAGDVLPASPIYFVLPYSTLEPLLEATSSRVGAESDPNWRVNLEQNLRDSDAEVTVVLGETTLPAKRVRALAAGDVLELERTADSDVEVQVEGHPVFHGRIGKSHQNYGVRITQRRQVLREFVDRRAGQTLVRKGLITREQLAVALIDERLNRRSLLDSIAARGWVERAVLEQAVRS